MVFHDSNTRGSNQQRSGRKGYLVLSIAIGLLAGACSFHGKTLIMSPKEDYATLEWAKAGDTVEIAPGAYQFRVYLNNHGTAQKPIIIKAKDPGNPPVWDLSGRDCGSWPGSYNQGDLKRGAWQIQGSHYIISDIVFKNAHTTRGGGIGDSSGLRVKGGYNITIRNCRFEGNDNGVSAFGENILYEN